MTGGRHHFSAGLPSFTALAEYDKDVSSDAYVNQHLEPSAQMLCGGMLGGG